MPRKSAGIWRARRSHESPARGERLKPVPLSPGQMDLFKSPDEDGEQDEDEDPTGGYRR